MVTLEINKILTGGIYRVTLTTTAFESADLELFDKYGEPLIQLGGTVTDGVNTYEIPDSTEVYLRTVFSAGVTKDFILADDPDAMKKANAWACTMQTRIATAMQQLRVQFDSFTRTYNVSL